MSDALDSIMFRPREESENLVILCSGRIAGFRDPLQFSMSFATRKLQANRLYIRDNFGMWYHLGLEGITTDMMGTVEFLKEHIQSEGYKRVSIIGVSSGGYAALVLGALLDVDELHAFGPPTVISRDMRDDDGSNVKDHLEKLFALESLNHDLLDARQVFRDHPRRPGTRTCIHYDPEHHVDVARIAPMKEVPGIEFVECPGYGHKVLQKYMKDKEFFDRIANGA